MSNIDFRFMDMFAKRPASERLTVYTQNLGQMLSERRVDLSDLIELCENRIDAIQGEIRRTTK